MSKLIFSSRVLLLFCALLITPLFITPLMGQTAVLEYQGDFLRFYSIGWGPEGRFAYITEELSPVAGKTSLFHLQIDDIIDDATVFKSEKKSYKNIKTYLESEKAPLGTGLRKFRIAYGKPKILPANFTYKQANFTTGLAIKAGDKQISGFNALKEVSITIATVNLGIKTIYTYKEFMQKDPDKYLINLEIKGAMLSPHEARVILILIETYIKNGKPSYRYRVTGANLLIGFKHVYSANVPPLVSAVLNGQYYRCKHLLKKGVDINTKDSRGYNALLLAARNKKWDITILLIRLGADPNTVDKSGISPLLYAKLAKKEDVIKLLKQKGAQ